MTKDTIGKGDSLLELTHKLWNGKWFIFKVMGICILVGIIIAFSIPKTYKVNIMISPESGQVSNGNLNGMASMLGISSFGNVTNDAINSSMFPDIINTTPFILEMYDIKVKPKDFEECISLSEYVEMQKGPWWGYILGFPGMVIGGIRTLFSSSEVTENETKETINPFQLTKEQYRKIDLIKTCLSASEDKKSGMTVVSAEFQDPLVAAVVADSAVVKLQKYIIDYRTRKAQADCEYLEKLCKERKDEYLTIQQKYADFIDRNRNVILQRTQAEGTRLQNDMSIAFQVYSQVETQLQVARAKVQEAKPVFAIVEPSTVPLRASSPNKPMILIVFIFLGFVGASAWILFGKDICLLLKGGTRTEK